MEKFRWSDFILLFPFSDGRSVWWVLSVTVCVEFCLFLKLVRDNCLPHCFLSDRWRKKSRFSRSFFFSFHSINFHCRKSRRDRTSRMHVLRRTKAMSLVAASVSDFYIAKLWRKRENLIYLIYESHAQLID